ncbi:CLUMA_CG008572, isoform A [Clunio marinus]|uniref:CLUMA_CG008572, isoform A n=1 Tax=Clunio marinus TaxID=568069 RepID=A0A1J1I817_9DIPT|nr:CLUMA_CG008572, isoform A [Clunio marinus]
MLRLEKYCWCLGLETAGLLIGWMSLISCIFYVIIFVISGFSLTFYGNGTNEDIYGGIGLWLAAIISVGLAYICWIFIQGIKTKNPPKMMPYKICLIVEIVVTIFLLMWLIFIDPESNSTWKKYSQNISHITVLGATVFLLIFEAYHYIFLDSLMEKLKDDKTSSNAV